jgi:uncharacterized membrane protein YqaE (UPF0057 family)
MGLTEFYSTLFFDIIFVLLQNKKTTMSCLQVILAIIFPPLAVIDRGCGSMLIVFLLTLCGWVPGVIAALIILNKNK